MTRNILCVVTAVSLCCADANALPPQAAARSASTFPSITAGMGVSYLSAQDVVDYVNALSVGERSPEFKSAVEFFGAIAFPLSEVVAIKLEYAYLVTSYHVPGFFGPGDVTMIAHLPTLLGQYVLLDERVYNVKVGVGAGYHFGTLTSGMGTFEEVFSGSGIGTKIDLEANTAFGESFFGYLGADLRWDFVGEARNSAGATPRGAAVSPPTLHFFSLGAKLGFTFYF